MDVPDRLPFEATERLWEGHARLERDHAVQPVQLVFATKTGGPTARPFVHVHPRDLLLYQALIDRLLPVVEPVLGSREEVFAYRLSEPAIDDALDGSPTWRDYSAAVLEYAETNAEEYIVQADVSSFYLGIRAEELDRRLLEAGANGNVVRDLRDLLASWSAEGVQGLPQGLMPSSVLANFYLAPVDRALRSSGVRFWRYMDDFAFAAPTFHAGREHLDSLEQVFYEDGLSLGADKTRIMRASSADRRFRTMRDRFEDRFLDLLGAFGDYAPDDDDEIGELRGEHMREFFDESVHALRRDEFRRGELTVALQELGRDEDGHALEELPYVLLRLPGLTKVASGYLASVSTPNNREALATALRAIVLEDRFHRPQEWMHLLRAVMVSGDQAVPDLAEKLEELALEHEHPLVRCRAILAWGRQSPGYEFEVVDRFVQQERRDRLAYAVVAIQAKDAAARNERYEDWGEFRPRPCSLGKLFEGKSAQLELNLGFDGFRPKRPRLTT